MSRTQSSDITKGSRATPGSAGGKVRFTCLRCGKESEAWPSQMKGGRRKYCSATCRQKATIAKAQAARVGMKWTEEEREMLSRAKKKTAPRGEKHSRWKGGQHLSNGRMMVMISTLSQEAQRLARMMTASPYVSRARVTMAVTLGRPLRRAEDVHHKNGNVLDDRPENLEVMGHGEHSAHHRRMEKLSSSAKT